MRIPLPPNIHYNSETAPDIEMKVFVPYKARILRYFCENGTNSVFFYIENEVLLTWRHTIVGKEWTKIWSVDRWNMKFFSITNR